MATANVLTISTAGVYEIIYEITNLTVSLGLALTAGVRLAGTFMPAASVTATLSLGVSTTFVGSTIASLSVGNTLDLALSALVAVTVSLPAGFNAMLSAKRIGT